MISILIQIKEMKKKILKRENFFLLGLILFIFLLDRFSKSQIIMNFSDSTFYYNDFLNFDLVWNTGIGFGLLSSDSILFYNLISVLIALVIFFLLVTAFNSVKIDKLILSIIIGGALGNFYDRLVYKAGPDFVEIHYGNFHCFTFNVADIYISIGIITFILRNFFVKI